MEIISHIDKFINAFEKAISSKDDDETRYYLALAAEVMSRLSYEEVTEVEKYIALLSNEYAHNHFINIEKPKHLN